MTEPTFVTNTPRPGETEEQTKARYDRRPGGITFVKDPRDALLVERQKTHGSFERNANISQELKSHFKSLGLMPDKAVHREALDMIALKLSRILSGQANYKDHWLDISGYAKLAMEACDEPRKE